MEFLKNQKIAIVIMVVLIVLSILTGAHRSLAALQQKTANVFVLGEAGDGIGIQNDLNERADLAYNMVVIGRKYLPEENPLIQNVLTDIEGLGKAKGPADKHKANQGLSQSVNDLYQTLIQIDLKEVDRPYPDRLYNNFKSRNDTISHDSYNQWAAEYNQVLNTFPASVLSKIVGIKPIELFH